MYRPLLKSGTLCSASFREECPHKLFGILMHRKYLCSSTVMYSITYLYYNEHLFYTLGCKLWPWETLSIGFCTPMSIILCMCTCTSTHTSLF